MCWRIRPAGRSSPCWRRGPTPPACAASRWMTWRTGPLGCSLSGRINLRRLQGSSERRPVNGAKHGAGRGDASQEGEASEMADAITAVRHSVEVPADPETAFRLYTAEINRWWKRGTHYWNDRHRAVGLRVERPARPA